MVSGIFGLPGRAALIAFALLVLGSAPGQAFITDSTTQPPPTTGGFAYYSTYGAFGPDQAGFPAKGQTFVDPVFGSTIRRLTKDFPNRSASDIYAKNGFWNADGTRMIHGTWSGYTIVDTSSGAVVRSGVPGNFDGSFAPDDPDTWYYLSGSSLRKYSIGSGTTALVRTFGATLGSLGGSTDWIDASGRYMVLRIGASARVWDKATDTLYAGSIPVNSGSGWIGISPDGKYVVATNGDVNKYSYAINHATRSVNTSGVLFWTLCGDHGDLVSASNGKSYLVTAECYSEAAIYAVDVSIPQSATNREKQRSDNRRLFNYDWNDDMHFSGVSKGAMRDWAFLSIESYDDGFSSSVSSWRPFKQEILMVNVLTGEVRRMAHHRSRGLAASYYHQPRVSASWNGGKVAWASNFGYGGTDYADIYAVDVTGADAPPPPGGDTTPPTITITNPPASATVSGTATLQAAATDNVGVVGVQFYVNGQRRGTEDTVPPYQRPWDTRALPAGTYTITAMARDAAGNRRSASITVIIKSTSGGTTGSTVQNVVWVDRKNVSLTDSVLRKSGGCDGCPDSGAGSAQAIASGDGYLQFSATAGPMGYFGLEAGTTKYDGSLINFGLAFQDNYMTVYESGRYRADTAFVSGDVFRIQIESGVVTYRKNGTMFYRSTIAPAYPLRANAAFLNTSARVGNAVIQAAALTASGAEATTQAVAWTNRENVAVTTAAITKTGGCDGCADAGARSVQRIAEGRGWLSFTVASPSGLGYVGLTNGAATTSGAALPFALGFQGRSMSVYESGRYRADAPLRAGDVFRIAVSATGVVSYLRNGVEFYRSALRAAYPLRAAAALYDAGTRVAGALIQGIR
jgi:hypothetical protein